MASTKMYQGIFSDLEDGVNILIFFKKDGTLRVMLATRDIITSSLCLGDSLAGKLNAHSSRCNINNGNIAVIDLLIGDVRSFSTDRLVRQLYLGQCTNLEDFNRYCEMYNKVNSLFAKVDTVITLDNLDIENQVRYLANDIDINNLTGKNTVDEQSITIDFDDYESEGNKDLNGNDYISSAHLEI